MTNNNPKVLIAIPAWNEQYSVGRILHEMKHLYPHLDILVVDDGSSDSTGQLAEEKGAKVVRHSGNLGYTAAIQTSRVYALDNGYDFLIFLDADGQHQVSDINRILDPLVKGDADRVIGSRELGNYEWKEPVYLRIPRWICSTLVSLKIGRTVTDATSGFKGENRRVAEYFKKVYQTSNKIHIDATSDIEEILLSKKEDFKLVEVPVIMHRRENSKTKCFTVGHLLRFPIDLIRTLLGNL